MAGRRLDAAPWRRYELHFATSWRARRRAIKSGKTTTIWRFLSIFPNTDGFSVVIPKAHHPSYAFDLPDEVLSALMLASKRVAKQLDRAFDDVGRCGMVFEGYGVDHVTPN